MAILETIANGFRKSWVCSAHSIRHSYINNDVPNLQSCHMLRMTFQKLEMLRDDSTNFESAYDNESTERVKGNFGRRKASKNPERNDQRTIVVTIVSTNTLMTCNNMMEIH